MASESLPKTAPDMPHAAHYSRPEPSHLSEQPHRGLGVLALLSVVVGVATGLVCAVFRLLLADAERWRTDFIVRMHDWSVAGLLIVMSTFAAAIAIAAWLVRRYSPYASGSGIPHVEGVLRGEVPPAPPQLLLVKFFGGLLAIGSGLALGREGPSVQMGATLSHLIGKAFQRTPQDCLLLLAAGGGAGLSIAFNAPIAGAVFVLEELTRRFDTRTTIVTFGASAGAISVGRLFLGSAPDFYVGSLPFANFSSIPLWLVLGVLAGIMGVAYNRAILAAMATVDLVVHWPVELRAAAIGAGVGLLGWFAPQLIGGGDVLTQEALNGTLGGGLLLGTLLLRFGLGPISYAARTPGGLFAPLLVLGAQGGLIFGNVCNDLFPGVIGNPLACVVTGTAAFFAAVVRAPLTGIILVIELTGSYTQLLPMLAACFTAMLVPTLLGNQPIYDSLKVKPR